ncbi:hypothetical protein GB928_007390 [Shinella curvata]|uniref:Uncharacterized protein n=1 Tax=Shinella curvata TaxID=1817964 RepID=A0ABT8XB89_9HYPH|nr:hypothetical protein [Shinella curvata]MCJ8053981.1 hypothetical protein [Shinella curvata]MDO6121003.1 hypothetical protein [Shinella curvata]
MLSFLETLKALWVLCVDVPDFLSKAFWHLTSAIPSRKADLVILRRKTTLHCIRGGVFV